MSDLKRTPLNEIHRAAGAKMVPFGGWDMPVQYTGIVDEHKAVRTRAGLFDVSHMGEFEIKGSRARDLVQYLTANDVDRIGVGRGQYSLFLNENGGAIDDIIVYRLGKTTYLIVVNASNIDKDWAHVERIAQDFEGVSIANRSDEFGLLALQGPSAEGALSPIVDRDLSDIGSFRIRQTTLAGKVVRIARTGYTGEGMNGFEIFTNANDTPAVWETLVSSDDVSPAGLGARDTLRIEASLPLYGHELNDETSPLQAGLDIFVSRSGGFIGSDTIDKQRTDGVSKTLVMLEMIDRGIPRQDYEVLDTSGQKIGEVTSGTVAPWIKKNIAMAYVSPDVAPPGAEVAVAIRNRTLRAKIVPRPFFKR